MASKNIRQIVAALKDEGEATQVFYDWLMENDYTELASIIVSTSETKRLNQIDDIISGTSREGRMLAVTALKVMNLDKVFLDDVRLSGLDLGGLKSNFASYVNAMLVRTNLSKAKLYGCTLRMANMSGAVLRDASVQQCSFKDANLTNADLRNIVAEGANFTNADMTMANLDGANMQHIRAASPNGGHPARMARVSAVGANFYTAYLGNVTFDHMDGRNAIFDNAMLSGASFRGADLRGADFSDAIIHLADFTGANVDGAKFDNAQGEDVIGLYT